LFFKETREAAVVTLVGRLFHARAAVTWKDRSPVVNSKTNQSISQSINNFLEWP